MGMAWVQDFEDFFLSRRHPAVQEREREKEKLQRKKIERIERKVKSKSQQLRALLQLVNGGTSPSNVGLAFTVTDFPGLVLATVVVH